MAAKMEKITCRFIGDFKVGDNLLINADALLPSKRDKRKRIVQQADCDSGGVDC
jgi:hypothetical protein